MDDAELDGRSDRTFPPTCRLTEPRQFRSVFAESRRFGGAGLVLLFRPNGLSRARLGLAISKKCARRAVDRARLKRIVRESFRLNRSRLAGQDIVAMCARGAPSMSSQRLFATLERAWVAIENQSCVDS